MIKTNQFVTKCFNFSTNSSRNIRFLSSLPQNTNLKCKSTTSLVRNQSTAGSSDNFQSNKNRFLLRTGSVLAAIGTIGIFWFNGKKHRVIGDKLDTKDIGKELSEFGREIKGLKSYTSEEVAKHNEKSKRIWVSYRSGVYDITDFIDVHPGGDKILMGSGGALEPFWTLFAVHQNQQVMNILEKYRIGNLDIKDRTEYQQNTDDPYANDPQRHPILSPRSQKPFNAEPPEELLVQNFFTPNEIFFVRNHLPVPEINVQEYRVEIEGLGIKSEKSLTLEEIKTKFPKHSVIATIQCSGNRRNEMNKFKEVKGLSWGSAAISNAEWSGARLIDVLVYCGIDLNDTTIKHIQFEGLDLDVSSMPYGASVEAFRALNPNSDFLLAYEMNGKEIPLDHGFPIRVIAPGITGARSVKWLSRIVLSHEESHSHWQRNDYKSFSPNIDWHNVDFESAPSIQETPVQSAICEPKDGQTVTVNKETQTIEIKGYAFSGGGRKVIRVDISPDQGINWFTAELKQEDSSLNRTYSWTLWRADIPVPNRWKSGQNLELICKATDSHYNSQPETAKHIWNLRGVLNNSWHKININLK